MSSEEIFSRFASRILVLACDLSADDAKQASGVLVSTDGFVVTNAHVVEECRSMTATQISGTSRRFHEAVLKYYDKKSDTAVLKIEGEGFDSFGLPTRTVRVGERVYAIGNPRGLEQSISEGIVSGLRDEDGTWWIQHSAPISPGSSGGALISSRGELLGINSWFVKESQGLNFAVPASTLARAYSGARDLRGSLKFPGSPPVSVTQGVTKPGPPPDQNPGGKTERPVPEIVLEKARIAALAYTGALPNYVCQVKVSRFQSETRPASFQPIDVVTMNLVHENGRDSYRDVQIDGKPTKKLVEEKRLDLVYGANSGLVLIDLFSPAAAAEFHFRRDSRAGSVLAKMYEFDVAREHSPWSVQAGSQVYVPAYSGAVWIDPETSLVLRIEMQAKGMPGRFPLDHVESATDYEYIRADDAQQYLLPVHAETLSCQRSSNLCARNAIDFRNYRRYQGESGNPAEQLVRLNVTVSDRSGHRIANLPQSAFTVLEDGVPQRIRTFKLEDAPVSMGLIIDSSGSMREQRPKVSAAALALVRDSNSQDEVFVVHFNDEAFLDNPHGKDFTSDIKEMEEALMRMDSHGARAMRDAIRMSIDHLKEKAHKDRKVLVVITGGDDDSSVVSPEDVVKASQDSGIPIYTVGLLNQQERGEAKRAKRVLESLSGATGGEAYFPKEAADVSRIAHVLAHNIRNQYTIAYTPSNMALDGSFRKISVVVKGPGSPTARTRQGYYATKDGL
jgi:VWFA-related protein